MSEKDGGPAFPLTSDRLDMPRGMSLRDYFAAAALNGLLAAGGGVTKSADGWAGTAYTLADAMLKERAK